MTKLHCPRAQHPLFNFRHTANRQKARKQSKVSWIHFSPVFVLIDGLKSQPEIETSESDKDEKSFPMGKVLPLVEYYKRVIGGGYGSLSIASGSRCFHL